MVIQEDAVPVSDPVIRCCDLLGLDPLHLANEGRCLLVVAPQDLERTRALIQAEGGAWIGEVQPFLAGPGAGIQRVLLRTPYGSERVLLPSSGELLPRIC